MGHLGCIPDPCLAVAHWTEQLCRADCHSLELDTDLSQTETAACSQACCLAGWTCHTLVPFAKKGCSSKMFLYHKRFTCRHALHQAACRGKHVGRRLICSALTHKESVLAHISRLMLHLVISANTSRRAAYKDVLPCKMPSQLYVHGRSVMLSTTFHRFKRFYAVKPLNVTASRRAPIQATIP